MKRIYESPELEISKFTFSQSILTVSDPQVPTGGGFIEEPEGDMEG